MKGIVTLPRLFWKSPNFSRSTSASKVPRCCGVGEIMQCNTGKSGADVADDLLVQSCRTSNLFSTPKFWFPLQLTAKMLI